jgi:hypothetical protein
MREAKLKALAGDEVDEESVRESSDEASDLSDDEK